MNSTVVIVRDRNQVTIPNAIIGKYPWIYPGAAIEFTQCNGKLAVEPVLKKKKVNWEEIWKVVKEAPKWGKQNVNLAEFIAKDRESH